MQLVNCNEYYYNPYVELFQNLFLMDHGTEILIENKRTARLLAPSERYVLYFAPMELRKA